MSLRDERLSNNARDDAKVCVVSSRSCSREKRCDGLTTTLDAHSRAVFERIGRVREEISLGFVSRVSNFSHALTLSLGDSNDDETMPLLCARL